MSPPISSLPDEVIMNMIACLEPADVLKVIACSRTFESLANNDIFWRTTYVQNFRSFNPAVSMSLSKRQIQQCCHLVIILRNSGKEWFKTKAMIDASSDPSVKYFSPRSVLLTRDDAISHRTSASSPGWACLSSTQDQSNEIIENVLEDDVPYDWEQISSGNQSYNGNSVRRNHPWWWSSASSLLRLPEETHETLLFTTKWRETVITEVAIKPLKDPYDFLDHNKVFSWPKISIKIYRLPHDGCDPFLITPPLAGSGEDRLKLTPSTGVYTEIDTILDQYTPTYESAVMDVESKSDHWQFYKIPDGTVGNLITFTLWGKNIMQYPHSGYFVCADHIAARGVPLIPQNEQATNT